MNKGYFIKVIFLVLLSTIYGKVEAQLSVSNSMTPAQLVDSILVGNGVSASNITYLGSTLSIGSFSNGNTTNIGLDEGILLTTGSILDAPGPNLLPNTSTNTSGGSDPQLAALVPGFSIEDAAVLEFDFIPLQDTIKLEYVFASEEYAEWVGTNYNDVFGFFVSGPNPSGGSYVHENLALVPGTTLPVTVNNINNGLLNNGTCTNCSFYINNTNGTTIEYDGFTTVLTSTLVVTPCVNYHIKIAIGDVYDHTYDSGIFLKSNSFNTNIVKVSATYSNPLLQSTCVEGCSDALVSFKLQQPTNYARTVHYLINGTAINGTDYIQIPDSVVIPANSDSASILISPIFDGITEGSESIQLIVQTSNCFTDTLDLVINDYTAVTANINGPSSICIGDSVTLTGSGLNGVLPFSYLWSTGDTLTTIKKQVNSPTSFSLIVTDYCAFSDTATVLVNIYNLPTVNVSPTDTTICIGTNATLNVSGALSYQWSPTSGLSSTTGSTVFASPTSSTIYTVTGTDSNGCKNSDQATVSVLPNPSLTLSSSLSDICLGDSSILSASGANVYSWTPSSSLNQSVGPTVVATPTNTTNYQVVGIATNGCMDSLSLTVNVHSAPTVVISPPNPELCLGQTKTLIASGAQTYAWTPSTFLNITTGSNVISSATTNTTYIVTGTDSWGCFNKDTVSLIVHNLPTVSVTPSDTIICSGTSLSLSAFGASTYSWTPTSGLSSSSGSSVIATPIVSTTYTVVGTDTNGCTDYDTTSITVSASPNVTPMNQSICIGDTAILSVSSSIPGTTFIWSTGSTLSSISVNPTTTTIYTIIATSPAGCEDSAQATVNVDSLPILTVNPSSAQICHGASVSLTASGAVTYSWAPSSSLSSATGSIVSANPNVNTTYTVVGQTNAGCKDSTTVSVSLYPQISVNIDHRDTIVCKGSTFSLTASGASSYSWSPSTFLDTTSTSSVSVTPYSNITYVVVGTDGNGCIGYDTSVIIVSPDLSAIASPPRICVGDSTLLSASATQTVTLLWSTGDTASSFFVMPVTTTSYTVTATDTIGCTDTDTVTVLVDTLPIVTITPMNPNLCNGSSLSMTASGANNYFWYPATNLSSTTGATVVTNTTNTITYHVIGYNSVGCEDTAHSTVTIISSPTVIVTPSKDTICQGLSSILTASGANNYTWSPSNGLSNTSGSSVSASPTNTTNYKVVGVAGNGCSDSTIAHIRVEPKPVLTINPDSSEICLGKSVSIHASGASTYLWSPAASLSSATTATVVASPITNTNYKIIGTTAAGCKDTASAYVGVNPYPVLTLTPMNPHMCPDDSITFIASGATNYLWSPTTGLSSSINDTVIAKPTQITSYQLIGSNSVGCADTIISTITVGPLPVILPSNPNLCINDSIMLTVSSNTPSSTFLWNNGLTSDTIWVTPLTTTTYVCTATDNSGCSKSDSVIVNVNGGNFLSILPANPSVCLKDSVSITASGASTYIWSPTATISPSTGSVIKASPAITSSYSVIGTTSNGCKDTIQFQVNVNPLPSVSVNPTSAIICGGLSTTIIASGATTYSWTPTTGVNSPTNDTVIVTPLSSTVYQVVGYDTNLCTDTATTSVTVYTRPVVTATLSNICPTDSTTITATCSSPPLSYLWSTSATTQSILVNPITSTTYSVTVTYPNGCVKSDSTLINVYTDPAVVASTANYHICPGDMALLIGSNVVSYQWSPTATLLQTSGAQVGAVPQVSTVYTVEGTSIHSCKTIDTVSITLYPQPNVIASASPNLICRGDTSLLSGVGVQSYQWSPNTGLLSNGVAQVQASPISSLSYILTGTDTNGCVDKDTIFVTVDQGPLVSVTPVYPVICEGDSVTLTALGAVTYSWSPNLWITSSTSQVIQAFPKSNTGYTVTGYDTNGCSNDSLVYVTVKRNPVLWVSPSLDSICLGDSIDINVLGAGGNGSYNWTPANGLSSTVGDSITASPAVTTTYYITGFSTDGCSKTITSLIKVNPKPILAISSKTKTICKYDSLVLSTSGADSYIWSPNGPIYTNWGDSVGVQPMNSTNFKVEGMTLHGCVDSAFVHIVVNQLPNVTVTSLDTSVCIGDSTYLNASGALTYAWDPNAALSSLIGASVVTVPNKTMSYAVTGTDANGCKNDDSVKVSVYGRPTVGIVTSSSHICSGDSIQLTGQSTAVPTTYIWSTGDTIKSLIVNPVNSIVYQVNGYNIYGCDDSATVAIQVNQYPQLSLNISDTIICDYDSINLSVMSSLNPVNFLWSTNATANLINVNPNSNTVYSVIGSDSIGCSDTAYCTVRVEPTPTLALSSSKSPSCSGDSIVISSNASIAVVSYVWSNSTTLSNLYVNPSTSTSYSVQVTDSVGCINSDIIFQQVNPIPIVNAYSSVNQLCFGDTVMLTSTSSVNSVNYLWSTGNVVDTFYSTPTTTYNYIVSGTDSIGCSGTDSVMVIVNQLPNVTVTSLDTSVCIGDSTYLNASGALTYAWDPNTALSSLIGSSVVTVPNNTMTYAVTGTDANGCINDDSVKVSVYGRPTIGVVASSLHVCSGDSILLTGLSNTVPTTYIWSTGNTINPLIVNPFNSIVYQVNGFNIYGCDDSATVAIQVNQIPQLSLNISDTIICDYDSINLSVISSLNPVNFLWSTNATANLINVNPNSNTVYSVIGSDSIGCSDTAYCTVRVEPIPSLALSSSNNPSCSGDSITILSNASAAVVSYVWSNNTILSNLYVNPSTSTTYSVQVVDSVGCINSDTLFQQVNPLPIVNAYSSVNQLCFGDSVMLTSTSSVNSVNYLWSTGNIVDTFYSTPSATYNYIVSGTDSVGCSGTDSVMVVVHNLPVISFTPFNAEICFGDTITINASSTPTAVSYLWSTGNSTSSITVHPASSVSYMLHVTDIHNCKDSALKALVVNPLPIVSVSPSNITICSDDTVILAATSNNPIQSILWNTNQTTTSIQVIPPLSQSFWFSLIDSNNCVSGDTADIIVIQRPTCTITAMDDTICSIDSVQIVYSGTGTSAGSYNWNFDGGNILSGSGSSPHWISWATGSFKIASLQVTENGCTSYPDTAGVMVYQTPVVDFTVSPTEACENTLVHFINNTPDIKTYDWDFGNPLDNNSFSNLENPDYTYANTGSYSVSLSVVSLGGCSAYGSFGYIQVYPNPTAGFDASTLSTTIIEPKVTIYDKSIGADYWEYDFDDPNSGADNISSIQNPWHQFVDTGYFNVRQIVSNFYGCADTAFQIINVEAYTQLYFPNAFTPDGDGLNDVFKVKGRTVDWKNFQMFIYNRWGDVVFQTRDPNEGWNGRIKNVGDVCPLDVYSVIIKVDGGYGEQKVYVGSITIVK